MSITTRITDEGRMCTFLTVIMIITVRLSRCAAVIGLFMFASVIMKHTMLVFSFARLTEVTCSEYDEFAYALNVVQNDVAMALRTTECDLRHWCLNDVFYTSYHKDIRHRLSHVAAVEIDGNWSGIGPPVVAHHWPRSRFPTHPSQGGCTMPSTQINRWRRWGTRAAHIGCPFQLFSHAIRLWIWRVKILTGTCGKAIFC